MNKLRKLLILVLTAAIVSFGVTGCKKKEHPNKEHPEKKSSAEHPTDGNKPPPEPPK